ncbi:hypothetical protein KKC32_02910 [Patescibacteria group bacterium]|nr:hypothetical protein [Patescibacteria group bacterium]
MVQQPQDVEKSAMQEAVQTPEAPESKKETGVEGEKGRLQKKLEAIQEDFDIADGYLKDAEADLEKSKAGGDIDPDKQAEITAEIENIEKSMDDIEKRMKRLTAEIKLAEMLGEPANVDKEVQAKPKLEVIEGGKEEVIELTTEDMEEIKPPPLPKEEIKIEAPIVPDEPDISAEHSPQEIAAQLNEIDDDVSLEVEAKTKAQESLDTLKAAGTSEGAEVEAFQKEVKEADEEIAKLAKRKEEISQGHLEVEPEIIGAIESQKPEAPEQAEEEIELTEADLEEIEPKHSEEEIRAQLNEIDDDVSLEVEAKTKAQESLAKLKAAGTSDGAEVEAFQKEIKEADEEIAKLAKRKEEISEGHLEVEPEIIEVAEKKLSPEDEKALNVELEKVNESIKDTEAELKFAEIALRNEEKGSARKGIMTTMQKLIKESTAQLEDLRTKRQAYEDAVGYEPIDEEQIIEEKPLEAEKVEEPVIAEKPVEKPVEKAPELKKEIKPEKETIAPEIAETVAPPSEAAAMETTVGSKAEEAPELKQESATAESKAESAEALEKEWENSVKELAKGADALFLTDAELNEQDPTAIIDNKVKKVRALAAKIDAFDDILIARRSSDRKNPLNTLIIEMGDKVDAIKTAINKFATDLESQKSATIQKGAGGESRMVMQPVDGEFYKGIAQNLKIAIENASGQPLDVKLAA